MGPPKTLWALFLVSMCTKETRCIGCIHRRKWGVKSGYVPPRDSGGDSTLLGTRRHVWEGIALQPYLRVWEAGHEQESAQ